MSDKEIHRTLSVGELFSEGAEYWIPMYQRNYAWEDAEITQLIQDIIDCMPASVEESNYYIGTLVVFDRQDSRGFETIDGQQRLTTLTLLACYLKNQKVATDRFKHMVLHFDCRVKSTKTLEAIFSGNLDKLADTDTNKELRHGYHLISDILPQRLGEHHRSIEEFSKYLFNRVHLLRVAVPPDTDLARYFEIMNNRGEQLEKHEILKSRMLKALEDIENEDEKRESKQCFHEVWEACSNMNRYVQVGFKPEQRNEIFGRTWDQFAVTSFDELRKHFTKDETQPHAATLAEIIKNEPIGSSDHQQDYESHERFHKIIDFPNFLLQVLRILTKDRHVPLDDKRLLSAFTSKVVSGSDSITRVKEFTFALLKCRFLLDHYILKSEATDRNQMWTLLQFTKNESESSTYRNTFGASDEDRSRQQQILTLLSAFHVSAPTMSSKHWLNGALNYLFRTNQAITAPEYLDALESLAKAFVFQRYLASGPPSSYEEIIYTNDGRCKITRAAAEVGLHSAEEENSDPTSKTVDWDRLTFDRGPHPFIFNYLDYLLWIKHRTSERVRSFVFRHRSSVEHFYPQHPLSGHSELPDKPLHMFGNLCLISRSKNSKLSNYMPKAKKEHYKDSALDSVKQHLMMEPEDWNIEAILKHDAEMKLELLNSLAD